MPSAVVGLNDGVFVEVEIPEDQVQLAGNAIQKQLDQSLDQIGSLSKKIVNSVSESLQSLADLVNLETIEVEYGISFSGEGNVYITKLSGSMNLKVKLQLKPNTTNPAS